MVDAHDRQLAIQPTDYVEPYPGSLLDVVKDLGRGALDAFGQLLMKINQE